MDGWVGGSLKVEVRSQNKSNRGTRTNQEHLHRKNTSGEESIRAKALRQGGKDGKDAREKEAEQDGRPGNLRRSLCFPEIRAAKGTELESEPH